MNNILRHPLTIALTALSLPVCSLEAISDREMSAVAGQAFITVDASSYKSTASDWVNKGYSSELANELSGQYEFTKVNLGLDIETLFTADSLRVGEFERTVYEDGAVPATDEFGNPIDGDPNQEGIQLVTNDADIIIDNFALGQVENYLDYENATIDPFRIQDPFIELAYKVVDGQRRVAGVRLGLGKTQGYLSGDILSLTGRLEGQIRGPVSVVYEGNCGGDNAPEECFLLYFAQSTEIYTQIDLVDGAKDTANYSYGAGTEEGEEYDSVDGTRGVEYTYPYADQPYLKRASWAGVPAGRNFQSGGSALSGLIPTLTNSHECIVSGTPGCFKLDTYRSIYVGSKGLSFEEGASEGAFLSLQTEAVPWSDTSGLENADRVVTQRGAFLNLSRYESDTKGTQYPLFLDLYDATNGTERVASCIGQLKGC